MSILKCVLCVSILLLRIFSALNSLNNEKSFFLFPIHFFPLCIFHFKIFTYKTFFPHITKLQGIIKCALCKNHNGTKNDTYEVFFAYTQKKNISIMFMCRHLLFFSLFLYFFLIFFSYINFPPPSHTYTYYYYCSHSPHYSVVLYSFYEMK